MTSWNPELYLKFQEERTQPAKDLIARIDLKKPERILDIGCGPGNSSIELKKRWTEAEIIGIDSSKSMIDKAVMDYTNLKFILADATGPTEFLGKFDLMFSNAAMQWMPGIDKLLPRLFSQIKTNGVMAMQIPNPKFMPIHIAVIQTAGNRKWKSTFRYLPNSLHLFEPGYYYDVLSGLSKNISLWETHYYHKMPGFESIIEWYSSTGMKPYLGLLNDKEKEQFSDEVLKKIKKVYPVQSNGCVLFPFRRIFFTAMKS